MSKPQLRTELKPGDVQEVAARPLSLDLRDDLHEVVPQLPTQTFVRVARELRDEQRLDLLVPHASPEQLTGIMDLDAWRGDRADFVRVREWLSLIVDCYREADKPRGALCDLVYEMDPELWTFGLLHGTAVADIDAEDDQARLAALESMAGLATYETPDGFYVVGAPDTPLGRRALRVIDAIYQDSLDDGRKLVSAIQLALPSPIEEDLLRWRSGRLADLGFPAWEDAMQLFRPLSPGAARENRGPAPVVAREGPGEPPVPWVGGDLLRRVMGRLSDAEHGVRAREFLLLVNELMAAQRMEPGDPAAQERAVDQTQATVSLGMEVLVSGLDHPDAEAFLAERLSAIGMRGMFRVGYGPLAKLREAAGTLHRAGQVSMESVGSLLDRPWGPALAALLHWYPELPRDTGRGTRPLRGLADVARATQLVAEAAALARLTFAAEGYGVDPAWIPRVDEPSRLRLGDLVRTAVIHAHLPGSRTTLAPLIREDLRWARDNLLVQGRLAPAARAQFIAACEDAGVGEHAAALADRLLPRIEAELGALELDGAGEIDLTRVGGLLTAQQVGTWLDTRARGAEG